MLASKVYEVCKLCRSLWAKPLHPISNSYISLTLPSTIGFMKLPQYDKSTEKLVIQKHFFSKKAPLLLPLRSLSAISFLRKPSGWKLAYSDNCVVTAKLSNCQGLLSFLSTSEIDFHSYQFFISTIFSLSFLKIGIIACIDPSVWKMWLL